MAGSQVSGAGSVAPCAVDPSARAILAEEIGQFLRRSAGGVFKGSSGRDRLSLQSPCYVVV